VEWKECIRNTKLFLFDQDGTLYLGNRLYDFTKELLCAIRDSGKQYLFLTNNSSKSVADYVKKLAVMGIAASREDFLTSSQATAFYLKKHFPGKILYVCGTRSLIAELESEGFTVATDLGHTVSAFDVIPHLIYPFMLLLSSLIFIFLIPEKK